MSYKKLKIWQIENEAELNELAEKPGRKINKFIQTVEKHHNKLIEPVIETKTNLEQK